MPTTNPTLPSDGQNADAADISVPIQAILAVINGHIDADNIEPGSLPWSVMDTLSKNIPATALEDDANPKVFRDEANIGFIASGCVWSAASGLNGNMTSGVAYSPNGARSAVSSITNHAFTASKDTYVDVATNGSISYSEVANGAAPPSITSDYLRIARVVTNGSAITAIHAKARTAFHGEFSEIGRTTLGLASDTITVGSLPAYKYLKIVISCLDTGGTIGATMTFNNDTGSNYAISAGTDGAADSSSTSQSSISIVGSSARPFFDVIQLINIAASEKIGYLDHWGRGTAGAGNAPNRREVVFKWTNTSVQINRIDITNGGTGDYAVGSEVIVYGHN